MYLSICMCKYVYWGHLNHISQPEKVNLPMEHTRTLSLMLPRSDPTHTHGRYNTQIHTGRRQTETEHSVYATSSRWRQKNVIFRCAASTTYARLCVLYVFLWLTIRSQLTHGAVALSRLYIFRLPRPGIVGHLVEHHRWLVLNLVFYSFWLLDHI